MLPNVLLPNQQYNLCLEKKQVLDGVYEEASDKIKLYTGYSAITDHHSVIAGCLLATS